MIVKKDLKTKGKPVIDLDGPQGNAFALLGLAQNFGRQLRLSKEEISEILTEMKSSNYSNLVKTFDKHFGSFVEIECSFDLENY